MLKLWTGLSGCLDVDASARRCRLRSLMAQMADRARMRGKAIMMMTNFSERCPDDEREERYREYESPNLSSIRHFYGTFSKGPHMVRSVYSEFLFLDIRLSPTYCQCR